MEGAESLVRLRLMQSKKAFPWPVDLEKSAYIKEKLGD